jgi:predicted metal-dependent hydrolase
VADFARKLRGDARFREGVCLFNEGCWFEAHEAWEAIWLHTRDEERVFLQGLIQAAAALHLVRLRRFSGARRVFAASIAKLDLTMESARELIEVERLVQQLHLRSQSIESSETVAISVHFADKNEPVSRHEVNRGISNQNS